MADRDKYGNYVNDKGVTIKISTDKNGNFGNNHGVASPNMSFRIVLSP